MTKYYRMNPYLGTRYEISKAAALRKIRSRYWVPAWDDYYQRHRDDAWYDIRDPERSWIFKCEVENEDDD